MLDTSHWLSVQLWKTAQVAQCRKSSIACWRSNSCGLVTSPESTRSRDESEEEESCTEPSAGEQLSTQPNPAVRGVGRYQPTVPSRKLLRCIHRLGELRLGLCMWRPSVLCALNGYWVASQGSHSPLRTKLQSWNQGNGADMEIESSQKGQKSNALLAALEGPCLLVSISFLKSFRNFCWTTAVIVKVVK